MNTTDNNAIEVTKLKKQFGDFVAVNEVSFTVHTGEIFGLLGPNGAGKTTLIRMMTTLTPPTSGAAKVSGHDVVTDADGVRHANGVIPQALTSDPELTARENMMIHAKLHELTSAQVAASEKYRILGHLFGYSYPVRIFRFAGRPVRRSLQEADLGCAKEKRSWDYSTPAPRNHNRRPCATSSAEWRWFYCSARACGFSCAIQPKSTRSSTSCMRS